MRLFPVLIVFFIVAIGCLPCPAGEFRAGAAVVDVTPQALPVLVNGGMLSRSVDAVKTPVNARAIVLDDGTERLAIVVVDSCMLPRQLCDDAKQLAAQRTGLKPNRILISATHTHSAPSSMGALGTQADPAYVPYLRVKLVEAIAAAEANLEPAEVGWAARDAAEFTALRRWIRRPDRVADDPFGNPTVRANMHAAQNLDDVTGESGPEDPALSLISFRARDGRPLAVLANFSMHYFSGERGVSADYFGLFCAKLQKELGGAAASSKPAFVGVMSHGCSGDIWRRDYRVAEEERAQRSIGQYASDLAEIAIAAYDDISYRSDVDLAMAEARLPLSYRVPDKQRLQWAQNVVAALGDRPPKNKTEVYALEQVILDKLQATEIVVQALRIGEIGIATTPNETYALTGLKIKLQSPLPQTMVIELANGGDGYIPPPEQHELGGYNTWPARSAGLEVSAEPKITEAAISLLEDVAARPRRAYRQSHGRAAKAILAAEPIAYWRLDEFGRPWAVDCSGNDHTGSYESGVVYFLSGPASNAFCRGDEQNRAAHFAGGRMRARLPRLGPRYTVALWIYNGMPTDARPISGWFFSRGRNQAHRPLGDHLGLGGTEYPGRVVLSCRTANGPAKLIAGKAQLARWMWNQVVLVRDGKQATVYVNGDSSPDIEHAAAAEIPAGLTECFFGGRCDNRANWEGRLDEVAVFDRALSAPEIQRLSP